MRAWDALVGALMRRPAVPLGLAALLVAGSAALAPGVGFSSDATEHLPTVSPQVKEWLELSRRFDAFNSLIVGLEEPERPFSAEGLAAVRRVTARLAEMKADGVLSVSSVTNVESIQEGADGSLEPQLLIPEVPSDPARLEALSQRVAADLQVSGALISRDQRGYLVLVRADPRKDTAGLARAVEAAVEAQRGPLTTAYFGAPFFSAVVTRGVYAKLSWLVPAFVGLLVVVLAIRVRRWGMIALVLLADAAALVVWLGIVRALGVVLSFSSLTALLVLAVCAALVFARGLEARLLSPEDDASPFPASLMAAVAAVGLASLSLRWLPVAFASTFGVVMAAGAAAIAVVGLLVLVPLGPKVVRAPLTRPSADLSPRAGRGVGVAFGLFALAVTGVLAARAPFLATPQTMFSARDDVGRSLAFFDRRFGGPDFVQVDYRGDLRDPDVAARLLRLSDLLEGSRAFPDVRTVAQVLGFLNKGFGGVHRVPPGRDALGALWFFLEGRSDVRNLATDARDEAMAVLRVPSRPERTVTELVTVVQTALADSLKTGPDGAMVRLEALARTFAVALPKGRVDEVLAAAAAPLDDAARTALEADVYARVRTWLASGDSPYQPTVEEWTRLEEALRSGADGRTARLTQVASGFAGLGELGPELVESVLTREKEARLTLLAERLAARLTDGVAAPPEAFRVRAHGVLVDLLDPHGGDGRAAAVTVTGLPVVAAQVERDLLHALWQALALLILLGGAALAALTRRPGDALRAVLEAAVASALTLVLAGLAGPGVDSGSAVVFLLPPLASLLLSDARLPGWHQVGFLFAFALAAATLLLVGVAPVTRIGAAVTIGLGCVVVVRFVSVRFGREG